MKNIHDVLKTIKAQQLADRDKGTQFEMLILRWLKTDPKYATLLSNVWMWHDFPYNDQFGYNDLGIDLVALTNDGEFWAIQCKCYSETSTIQKADVDTFLATSARSFIVNQKNTSFAWRVWISTTNSWSKNADQTLRDQTPPVIRVNLSVLESSPVDWEKLLNGKQGKEAVMPGKQLMKHQYEAIQHAINYYKNNDRGKLIMACGTGKTFTSLRIVENIVGQKGLVLFLVPSIALLGQAYNDWATDAQQPFKPIYICSDPKAATTTKNKQNNDTDNSILDSPLPATTNPDTITQRLLHYQHYQGLVIIFSTYQSIDVVHQAQLNVLTQTNGQYGTFNFIVCDEAHRTTGVKLSDNDESNFTKIHSHPNQKDRYKDYIKGNKRMYMTATPRIYGESAKVKASHNDLILCSMDDTNIYGNEIYRVGFSYAVQQGILTDYKVLVLTVSNDDLPNEILNQINNGQIKELNYDTAARLIGVINALSKKILGDNGITKKVDPTIMKRALAFTYKIGSETQLGTSKNIAKAFPILSTLYTQSLSQQDQQNVVQAQVKHVDGTMTAPQRAEALHWLAQPTQNKNECHIITNVRCLSEGVDVPALDAVIFLSAKNSQVDVVQSVGRVMRSFHKGLPDEKKYGYIIIPIVVPKGTKPEDALDDNKNYAVVWDILNALRSHDDNFNAHVNTIALNDDKKDSKVLFGVCGFIVGNKTEENNSPKKLSNEEVAHQLEMRFGNTQQILYAKLVEHCGDRLYWENWAGEVGKIAKRYIQRITQLVRGSNSRYNTYFNDFIDTLRRDINASITDSQCVEMLAQHMITKPVFEALFKDYKFVSNNSVSKSMQFMVELLETETLESDVHTMNSFYESVRTNIGNIDNLKGKQSLIKTLYEKFFKIAFPKTVEQNGIVYTPIECVDFIIRSVNDILLQDFHTALTNENVFILDPFVGTGTFITRLLQLGVIKKQDLIRKYTKEIFCNEILLLPYYVADVNIESVYHELQPNQPYLPFDGICLTDTFQLSEHDEQPLYSSFFTENSKAVAIQRRTPVRVIIGNPPYSVGQKDANDNAQNNHYPRLEQRIRDTYAANTTTHLKKSLYDSYVKAYRWASDRLSADDGGIIGFISNGSWLDGSAQEGMRVCFEKEFDKIYVLNLRGNARTSGEMRRKEGGGLFADGSRSHIAITLLVKYPKTRHKAQPCQILYHDIGDYLTRNQKLNTIKGFRSVAHMTWTTITPNKKHDWINQRGELFDTLIPIADKKNKADTQTFFLPVYSNGLKTNRDAWCYNSSAAALESNLRRSIDYYNAEVDRIAALCAQQPGKPARDFINYSLHPQLFSWDAIQRDRDLPKGKKYTFTPSSMVTALYRPFFKQHCYFNRELNARVCQWPQLFPAPQYSNQVICVDGIGSNKDFTCLITDVLPDLQLAFNGQCFPLYYYTMETSDDAQLSLFPAEQRLISHPALSEWIVREVRSRFNNPKNLNHIDIFYYVYGLLHSPSYRTRFSADLKKSLPRLPIVTPVDSFMAFSQAGRHLANLHLNYDKQLDNIEADLHTRYGITVKRYGTPPQDPDDAYKYYYVSKLRYPSRTDKSTLILNSRVAITDIPPRTYQYMVNGKSAVDWLVDRYQVTTDKETLIVNDPNAFAREHHMPDYLLRLFLSVINVSLRTLDIVDNLPPLNLDD